MNAEKLLDILGNESRRRILSLLSQRPCYVSEIAYCLKMAPKVVLEHLYKLERAGIIKSFEDGKRRYYYIDKSLRLEVTLTPHNFSAKVVESGNIDEKDIISVIREINSMNYSENLRNLFEIMSRMERVQDVLSRLQYKINLRVTEILEELLTKVERFTRDEIERIVLYGLAKGLSVFEIVEYFGLFHSEVESALRRLEDRGLVERCIENGRIVWKFRG